VAEASAAQVDLVGTVLDASFPAFFRYRRVGESVVLTNQEGGFLLVTLAEFRSFAEGSVAAGTPLWDRLRDGNFLRSDHDAASAADCLGARMRFLQWGPSLHSVAVVGPGGALLPEETADAVLDLVFSSTSPSLTIEFLGGEPLANFPVVRHLVDRARERNAQVGKTLDFSLVSDLSRLDDATLEWILSNGVRVRATAPAGLPSDATAAWLRRLTAGVEVLLNVTRESLPAARECAEAYAELGCSSLLLLPGPSVSTAEFLAFHRAVLDLLLERSLAGSLVFERRAAAFLAKILLGEDPGFPEVRNPAGGGTGSLAYDVDGTICTGAEGLALRASGDDTFVLGNVVTSSYREVVGHETVRAVVLAGNLDARPDCVNCAYNPYCGVSPVQSHRTQGSIFGRMRDNELCAVYKGIQDDLFLRLGFEEPGIGEVLRLWAAAARVEDEENGAGS